MVHTTLEKRLCLVAMFTLTALLAGCGGQEQSNPEPSAFVPTAIGYVANTKSNSITSFLLDENTGALASAATVPTGRFPIRPAISPNRQFLFISNSEDRTISKFRLDGNGGMQPLGTPVNLHSIDGQPWDIVIAPSGKFLYVGTTGRTIEAFTIDQQTGDLNPLLESPFSTASEAYGVTLSHNGLFLYGFATSGDAIYVFGTNSMTGSLTPLSTVHIGLAPCAITVDPADRHLLVNACEGKFLVYRINSSGAFESTPISSVMSAFYGVTIAVAPNGRFVYVDDPFGRGNSNLVDNAILGYSLDTDTGSIAPMSGSPFLDNQSPSSVAVSPTGTTLVVSRINPGHIASYRIHAQTGSLSPISGTLSDSGIPTGNSPNKVLLVQK